MNTFFFLLMIITALSIPCLLITSLILFFKRKQKAKKFLKITGISLAISFFSLVGFSMTMSPELQKEALNASEEKKEKEHEGQEEKAKAVEQQEAVEQQKIEEQRKAAEQQKIEEQQKAVEQQKEIDKAIYEEEIKPEIDSMMKEYDDIWNQYWRPTWEEVNTNLSATQLDELQTKMEDIHSKYLTLANEIANLKAEDKLKDPGLKEQMENFSVEFVKAASYRANAASAVKQGLKGIAPMEDRMEEAKKSIDLSDEKLINAVAAKVQLESELGIQ